MFLLFVLLSSLMGTISASQYTLTRRIEITKDLVSLKTTLVHCKTGSEIYVDDDFVIRSSSLDAGTKRLVVQWRAMGSGSVLNNSVKEEFLRRLLEKARKKFFNAYDSSNDLDAIREAIKDPCKTINFNRTDLPDEPASPVEQDVDDKKETEKSE